MDYEYTKEQFLKHPHYYLVGLQNLLFTNYKFAKWIWYAIWQSFVLMIISFVPFETQGGGLWMEGNFVYLGLVIIVNIKILTDTHNHTVLSLMSTIVPILMFIGASILGSNFRSLVIFGTIQQQATSIETYYILIFMLFALVMVDIGVNYINRQIRMRMMKFTKHINERYITPIFRKSSFEEDVIRPRNLTSGFAFSQSPGNTPQIINKVLYNSLLRKSMIPGSVYSTLLDDEDYYKSLSKSKSHSHSPGLKNQIPVNSQTPNPIETKEILKCD